MGILFMAVTILDLIQTRVKLKGNRPNCGQSNQGGWADSDSAGTLSLCVVVRHQRSQATSLRMHFDCIPYNQ